MSGECERCGEHALECVCHLKPCINCETPCSISPVQLGDFATLTYLRVCSGDCMFALAYEFMYGLYEHKNFRNSLFDKENEEDRVLRKKHQDQSMNAFLKEMSDHFEKNPNILSNPHPPLDIFKDLTPIPHNSGKTVRFIRFSKPDREKWQKEYIQELQKKLQIAEKDLEKIMAENE